MNSLYAVAIAEYGKKPETLFLYDTLISATEYCLHEIHGTTTMLCDKELYIIDIESGTVIFVYRVHNGIEVIDTIKRKIFITCEELGIDYQALYLLAKGELFDA